MTITVKYFGVLAEITQCSEETLLFTETKITELLAVLFKKYPKLKEKDFQIAQNKVLVPKETMLAAPEIALLPPFAGG